MLILGIESSCDDTSVALLDCSQQGCFIISQKTASQIDIHKKYGGVVPELAGRVHAEKIAPLIEMILTKQKKPQAIAVTAGPGLITGLLVGVEAAKTLSYIWDIPLLSVNHIAGHIYSPFINKKEIISFPAMALIASGGHTELILITDHGKYKLLGATKDDAAGECFDKVAKLLDLPYPGGPEISKLAKIGRSDAIDFPRPMLNSSNYNFSFSGLKTAALYWLQKNEPFLVPRAQGIRHNRAGKPLQQGRKVFNLLARQWKSFGFPLPSLRCVNKLAASKTHPRDNIFAWLSASKGIQKNKITKNDFCASFEQAIVDVLIKKTARAIKQYNPKTVILAGGVSANKKLRNTLAKQIPANIKYQLPNIEYSMDNAAMIAVAGYYQSKNKNFTPWHKIQADPNWKINLI